MGFLESVGMIREGLKWYRDVKTLYTEGMNVKEIYQKKTKINVESREELLEGFLASKIDYQDHVKIEGILIDYAHLYKPKSYINSIEVNNPINEEEKGGRMTRVLDMSWKPFQLPVSKIPSVQTEDGLLSLAFLYPFDFEGFTYPGVNAFTSGPIDVPTFDIPRNAKPIPILLRQEDIVKNRYKHIELTGKVGTLPDQLVKQFRSNAFSTMAFSDVANPINEKMPSICLKVNTNKGEIKKGKAEKDLTHCPASIFLETHIEGNVNRNLIQKIPEISSKILVGSGNGFSTTKGDISDQHPTIFQINMNSKINLIGKFPNVLGFYLEGNLVNLEEDFLQFSNEFNTFTRKLHETVPYFKLNLDFMHDYQLQSYLDSPLLNSYSSNSIIDKDLTETMDWLKS
ncbi:hypothetical protein ACQ4XT_17845 [Halobacillus faecis]